MTTEIELEKIELGKLMPNPYNPRRRMTEKRLETLKNSLKEDGQLQTITVRPQNDAKTIPKGHYEVVAGMRRYLSFKAIQNDSFKIACTVRDMDDDTAMDVSYRENKEREQPNPMDDARYFFGRLHLKEEQIFTPQNESETDGEQPLPSEKHPEVIKLAKKLSESANVIETRLTFLALPKEQQDLIERTSTDELKDKEIPMGVYKARVIARLRLIGNEEDAHKQMKIIWRTWGDKDGEDIEKQVTSVLDSYRKQADDVLKELGTLEKTLEKRKKELNDEVKKCTEWINPSNKKSIIHQLPDEIKENITVEITEEPEDLFVTLGDLVTDLTKDDTLSDRIGELKSKQNNLIMGQEHLEGDTCIYCDSDVDTKELDKKIDALSSEIDTVDSAIETKDSLRGDTEKLKRGLGENIKQFTEVVQKYKNSLDKLVTAKKITKQQANEKLKNFGID